MGEVKDLSNKEAVNKIREIANDAKVCMFATNLVGMPFSVRPMTVQEVDEDGKLYFLSSRTSDCDQEILADPRVQLIFSDHSKSEYLSVYGRATVSINQDKKDEIWEPLAKAWFPKGKNDPDLTVLEIEPTDAYYWDTKDGKIVSMIKILASAMTGEQMDGGVKGELHV